ncbi:plasmid pRiA4b ORF-3 family protein [Synechococcales cyanobacterium C]|uniref:Plasmid pRiA4b ORF-3 family protein n=1 Tax=Petrachloros mirabilis ULC683 TaxID=2781853 RepID=A0A8K1ZW97_9CYAN|nr:plasmid pRiA4b ORF-3 family protein [Petrachloros mirabilis]NCJ05296.1 plasmid pRiA4b ORF-3 family protein [Petrachloros mirabilis ULC683]
MPKKTSESQPLIYQLKVSLKRLRPPIWRRVQVPSTMTLGKLHKIIQLVMGWYDCHLHEFEIHGQSYGQPDPDFGFEDMLSERNVRLERFVTREKFKFSYVYDMGDCWEHEILVEKVLPVDPEVRYPCCIKGKRACPPEDCGGVWGYAEFLEAIQDPENPEHSSMLEWIGGSFDPEEFSLEEANQQLKRIR